MRPGTLVTAWGAGEHVFRLGIGEWRAVQAKCDAGPDVILGRLFPVAQAIAKGMTVSQACALGLSGGFRVDDMREVILQGLIGGGLGPIEAANLVRNQVDEVLDFKTNLALAYAIVKASLDDGAGEPAAAGKGKGRTPRTPKPRSPTAKSASPGSTARAPRSASRPATSTP